MQHSLSAAHWAPVLAHCKQGTGAATGSVVQLARACEQHGGMHGVPQAASFESVPPGSPPSPGEGTLTHLCAVARGAEATGACQTCAAVCVCLAPISKGSALHRNGVKDRGLVGRVRSERGHSGVGVAVWGRGATLAEFVW